MGLYYKRIIEFVNTVAPKLRSAVGVPESWPFNLHHWEALSEDQQSMIYCELNDMLCKLGRHDYEYVTETEHGYELKCFYCGAVKRTNGGK